MALMLIEHPATVCSLTLWKTENITVAPDSAWLRSDLYIVAPPNGAGNDRGLYLTYTCGKVTARKEAL